GHWLAQTPIPGKTFAEASPAAAPKAKRFVSFAGARWLRAVAFGVRSQLCIEGTVGSGVDSKRPEFSFRPHCISGITRCREYSERAPGQPVACRSCRQQ